MRSSISPWPRAFPCCDCLPRTARSSLPVAMVCNMKSRATCSMFCAAAPTSPRGSLLCAAQRTAVDACHVFAVLRSPNIVVVHPDEPRVLRGEGKSFDARRRSKLCANRNRHRPYKHRLGLFMDREMMIEPVMWCQPQDAVVDDLKNGLN
uniref:Uncharacterized protein n=1 Tax=Zea mays TaxID=4577 RepID=A0A804ULC8_MAIZE